MTLIQKDFEAKSNNLKFKKKYLLPTIFCLFRSHTCYLLYTETSDSLWYLLFMHVW